MGQQKGVVQDTLTGLYCTDYSTTLSLCGWGNGADAVLFSDVATAQAVAADMNAQATTDARFIGTNPPPH